MFTIFNRSKAAIGIRKDCYLGPEGTERARALWPDPLPESHVLRKYEADGNLLIVEGEVKTYEEALALKGLTPPAPPAPPAPPPQAPAPVIPEPPPPAVQPEAPTPEPEPEADEAEEEAQEPEATPEPQPAPETSSADAAGEELDAIMNGLGGDTSSSEPKDRGQRPNHKKNRR